MTTIAQWDGEGFVPIGRYKKQADAEYVVGQVYTIDVVLERSNNTHRHFFASVNEVWLNLPEGLAERFPTSEHLRKYALIRGGYADERSIICATPEDAVRVAAFVQPMDSYAVVTVSDYVVRVFTAQSQSYRTMGAKTFQDSKAKVLEFLTELIGVTPEQLRRATA